MKRPGKPLRISTSSVLRNLAYLHCVPEARERERYGGRVTVPRQRDERLANPEKRGRGMPRLAMAQGLVDFLRNGDSESARAKVRDPYGDHPALLR